MSCEHANVNKMLALNDPIEKDVLTVLLNAPQNRLQRCKIKQKLEPKYEGLGKKYAKGSFDPVLQRRLDRLCSLDVLKKEYVERSAFYFITDEAKDEVKLLVEKQEIKKAVDQMTPEEIQELKDELYFYQAMWAVSG